MNKGISTLFLDECDIIANQLYKERTEAIENDKLCNLALKHLQTVFCQRATLSKYLPEHEQNALPVTP